MTTRQARPSRLLIVDDDKGMRETLTDILESTSYSVEQAADGSLALERIRAQSYDLVLMDVRMPVLDGVETLRRIRALQPDLPVILMSGNTGESAVTGARREATAIVAKPLDLPALIQLIEAMLAREDRT
jgi:CheY-like chemotaxis protein